MVLMESHKCVVQAWNKDVLPAASGQSPGNGEELTTWKTKLLSHFNGLEEARIPNWASILVISLTSCMFCICVPVRHLKLRILCTEPTHWSEHPSFSLLHSQIFFPLWLIFSKDCWLWKKRRYLRIYSDLEIPFLEGFEVKYVISKERESRVNPFLSKHFFFFIIWTNRLVKVSSLVSYTVYQSKWQHAGRFQWTMLRCSNLASAISWQHQILINFFFK